MPDASAEPVIFISYSHKDRTELEYIRSHLSAVERLGKLIVWDDNELQIGDDWKGDINSALDACQVFILIVSRHSLASRFIKTVEVARILERRRRGEAVALCPIVATPCHIDGIDWLDDVNRKPKDGNALSELAEAVRDREMTAIVADIAGIVAKLTGSETIRVETPALDLAPTKVLAPDTVNYVGLPETPYKKLVGREQELTTLDEAWVDKLTNIVSLVAWGGAGKSALVNEWLKRLREENYRGAEIVLGWSFYSQGTKERATSADGFLDWALTKLNIRTDFTSAAAKGEKLAELMAKRRVLMVLDGVEPLQHGPGGQHGLLKDQGLRMLLRRFVATPPALAHGLIVITTRLAIRDIDQWKRTIGKSGPAIVIDVGQLSDDAGAELLSDNGIKGPPKELRAASREFEGHALALNLLASFLGRRHRGDIQRRDRIGPLLQKSGASGHDHARRVMQAYESEWLKDEPLLTAILSLVGLFDRPASADCLAALREPPAIKGLTEPLVNLSADEWSDAVATLRDVHLLDPEEPTAPGRLDAHPLVREWFGERLRRTNEKAWKVAHGRLYEHLSTTTDEGKTPTLVELGPLYQAIAHGCRSDNLEGALSVYTRRICRSNSSGRLEYYSFRRLGAFASDLATLANFFEVPFELVNPQLSALEQRWLINITSSALVSQGRLVEALPGLRAAALLAAESDDLSNAAIGASNLGETELLVGEIASAVSTAEKAIEQSRKVKGIYEQVVSLNTCADIKHQAGRLEDALRLFAEAERIQGHPLYSVAGYRYGSALLAAGEYAAAGEAATHIVTKQDRPLELAFQALLTGRILLASALRQTRSSIAPSDLLNIQSCLRESIDGFLRTDQRDDIPRAYLAKAAFSRSIGDWDGAARDLDEVDEIAEPGPMKLYLCDAALERARIIFARGEAFAPLNGINESPPKPTRLSDAERENLYELAAEHLRIAANYIEECGYHRRDDELNELQAALRGDNKFAELPPRV